MMSTVSLEKIPTESMFEILRDRICLLDYPPGMKLREADLAAEFGVSRTPIRAVLQRLTHAGLIDSRDGFGTVVTDLTDAEVRDIYLMRLKIAEMIGVMSPIDFSAEFRDNADRLMERAKALTEKFAIEEYWRINHDLHFMIAGIIGNTALRQMWDHFYFQAARIWYRHVRNDTAGVAEALFAELQEVSRAVREGDAVALGYIQRNHIAYGLKRLNV
jgi:DNA-binding GntR family transcriptional regulator